MGLPLRSPGQREPRRLVATESGRIDAIIAAADPTLTRARVQRLLDDGLVLLNGAPVRKSTRLAPGDTIDYEIPLATHDVEETRIDVAVLYEDDALVVVDKPAGLNTHGAPGDTGPSVARWFAARYLAGPSAFDAERPGIVHRLDRDTTGVLVLARSPEVQAALSSAFETRQVEKTYVALSAKTPDRERALIDAPIGRHPADRTRMAIVSRGRPARTRYHVVAATTDGALLQVQLETGRTHQVRVHLAAVGAPIIGDAVYGSLGAPRQMLHAWRLTIPHPGGGRLSVIAPLPADMRDTARQLGLQAAAMPYCEAVSPFREPSNLTPGDDQ